VTSVVILFELRSQETFGEIYLSAFEDIRECSLLYICLYCSLGRTVAVDSLKWRFAPVGINAGTTRVGRQVCSVRMTTSYRLRRPGFYSRQRPMICPHSTTSIPVVGAYPACYIYNRYRGFSPGGKAART
jgi:hypothetical protein